MKQKLLSLLVVALLAGILLTTAAMAASPVPAVQVRVNGHLVRFPDGQPYIDENGRTLIPVRFVSEQLNAKVTWDSQVQTAHIKKDGILVDVVIGDRDLTVTKEQRESHISMDTAAVLQNGRTYVPIRYVAEALGAYVDYSDVYKTVGIYLDVFSPEEIKALRAYPYTQPDGAVSYADAMGQLPAETLAFRYGTCRDRFDSFENAHEHLYHTVERNGSYSFHAAKTSLEKGSRESFYTKVLEEAIAELSYRSDRLQIDFLADNSCLYQPDSLDGIITCVRGIAKIKIFAEPVDLTGEETLRLCKLGFTQITKGLESEVPVDVHMNTSTSYWVDANTIAPLAKAN